MTALVSSVQGEHALAGFLDRHRRAAALADRRFDREELDDLLRGLSATGVIRGWVAHDAGGAGFTHIESAALYEELGRVWPELAGVALIAQSVASAVATSAHPAIRERYAARLLAGELIGCVALSETGAGSNPREMVSAAHQVGACWHVSGEKTWVTNGMYADLCIFVARTGEGRFTRFLLERSRHGFEASPIDALGLRGWGSSDIRLMSAEVEPEHVLGEVGRGLEMSYEALARSRTYLAAIAVGIGQSALDAAVAHARSRVQFGKLLGAHQLIQDMVAEMATLVEASRQLVHRSLRLMDQRSASTAAAAMAKHYATESVLRVCSLGVQVHGAQGLTTGHAAERQFRNARMLTMPDGTTQMNRLIVARELLGTGAF